MDKQKETSQLTTREKQLRRHARWALPVLFALVLIFWLKPKVVERGCIINRVPTEKSEPITLDGKTYNTIQFKEFGGYHNAATSKKIGNPKKAYQALYDGGKSGFNGLKGGYRNNSIREYHYMDNRGFYWSGTALGPDYVLSYGFAFGGVARGYFNSSAGFSCRCIKNGRSIPKGRI